MYMKFCLGLNVMSARRLPPQDDLPFQKLRQMDLDFAAVAGFLNPQLHRRNEAVRIQLCVTASVSDSKILGVT